MQKLLTLAILALFGHSLHVSAQSSPYLDPSFGINGRLTYLFQGSNPATDAAGFTKTISLPNGKILAVGSGTQGGVSFAGAVRFNYDGSVDTTFANHGEWKSNDPNILAITQLLLQPDGKILLGGSGSNGFKLVRLLPDGSYDNSFGINGKVSFYGALSGIAHVISDMALLPDGGILMHGYFFSLSNDKYIIAKFKPNGALDTSFGQAGSLTLLYTEVPPGNEDFVPRQIVPLSDKSFLISGGGKLGSVFGEFAMHFSQSGRVDTTFGDHGVTFLPNCNYTAAVFVLPNDQFYMLMGSPYPTQTALFKFHKNGILDTTFADKGLAIFHHSSPLSNASSPFGGILQDDGKIVILGGNANALGFLGRYNADGSRDTTFGDKGVITPETTYEIFFSGDVQDDGKLLAISRYKGPNGNGIGNILRYIPTLTVGVIETPSPLSAAFLYPNPVRQSCKLQYELPQASSVHIELLDMEGQTVQTLLRADRPAGPTEENLCLPEGLPAGQYLLLVATNKGNAAVKLVVTR